MTGHTTSDRTLRKSIYLRASPAQVWAYLTEPDKRAIWFHKPEKPLVAGPYELFGTDSGDRLIWGEVLLAEPYSRLDYSFTVAPMGEATSTVRWRLEDVADGTRLSMTHEGLPEGSAAFDLILAMDKGWDDHMARMRQSLHDI